VSHAYFLRSQGAEYHGAAHSLLHGDADGAGLAPADRALLTYAEKLTREPAAITDADTDVLRGHGFDDAQLWEAAFTTSIFNLFPRMAEAFGIAPPAFMLAALGLTE
jgi:alkylhydroperoxidase family enzyme